MFSDGSHSHFWELRVGEYLLFCQCSLCGATTRRSDDFSVTSRGSFLLFLFPSPATLTRPKGILQRQTGTTVSWETPKSDPLTAEETLRTSTAMRAATHSWREFRKAEQKVRGFDDHHWDCTSGERLTLDYTDSVGDWSSALGLISWTLVRIFFWCPAKDTPILWRSLERTKTKTGTLTGVQAWAFKRKCLLYYLFYKLMHMYTLDSTGANTDSFVATSQKQLNAINSTFLFNVVTK